MKNLNTLISSGFNKMLTCIPETEDRGITKPPFDSHLLENNNNKPETFTVADIGHHQIVVFIARININKKIEIIGFGDERTKGMSKGTVSDILKLSECLETALNKASAQAGFIPKSIYACISCAVKTYEHQKTCIKSNGSEISTNDIKELKSGINQLYHNGDETILYAEPTHFTVDGLSEILNPVGMQGILLEANFKVLTCPSGSIDNLQQCCDSIGISLKAVCPAIVASAESILDSDERTEGVVLVDIGAEKSSIAIYKNNSLFYTETIPLGGNHITNDICQYTGLPFKKAEELKIEYNKAIYLDSDEVINIKSFKNYTRKDLAFVIQCRLIELLKLIDFTISSHIDKEDIIYGVVFTGGTSNASLFHQLLKPIFKTSCFIYSETKPIFTSINLEIKKSLNNPLYTSALGVLKMAINNN